MRNDLGIKKQKTNYGLFGPKRCSSFKSKKVQSLNKIIVMVVVIFCCSLNLEFVLNCIVNHCTAGPYSNIFSQDS